MRESYPRLFPSTHHSSRSWRPTQIRCIPFDRARRGRSNDMRHLSGPAVWTAQTCREHEPAREGVTLDFGESYPRLRLPSTAEPAEPANDVRPTCIIYHSKERDETRKTVSSDFRCISSSPRKLRMSRALPTGRVGCSLAGSYPRPGRELP